MTRTSIAILFFILNFAFCCSRRQQQQEATGIDSVYFKTFHLAEGFGYEIYVNDKKYIYQPHIPGMDGAAGFDREDQAVDAANLVVHKIKNSTFPPTITPEEILSILNKPSPTK